jgi:polyhydroxyalkanoate synthesis regulator protein
MANVTKEWVEGQLKSFAEQEAQLVGQLNQIAGAKMLCHQQLAMLAEEERPPEATPDGETKQAETEQS